MSDTNGEGYAEWTILELMGHRRLGGFVTGAEIVGIPLLRIDITTPSGDTTTQYYGKAAIYCLTPTTEEIAKAAAVCFNPPIHHYEIAPMSYDGDGQEGEDEDQPF